MTVINTNVRALVAAQASLTNDRAMSKTMQALSTGKRINSAGDDAAGLAITDKMTAQIRGLNQAVRNANDGISMLQTVEGSTNAIADMLQRMRELSVQASNDTYDDKDLKAINNEFAALAGQITAIGKQTTWNGIHVANGTPASVEFKIDAEGGDRLKIDLEDLTGGDYDLSKSSVEKAADAITARGAVDTAIASLDAYRSKLGAGINQLQYASDNLNNISTNTAASRSRILDTDYALATTELARTQIVQQAATAMLAQANQSTQMVLSLLKG